MVVCEKCKTDVTDNFVNKKCQHKICYKCMYDFVKKNLKVKINCPISYCPEFLSDQIIRKCLTPEKTTFYENLSVLKSSNQMRKCLTKKCPFIISVANDQSVFICTYCDQPNCLKCQKRHYPRYCGIKELDEKLIDHSANESMRNQRRKHIDSLCANEGSVNNPDGFSCNLCTTFILPQEGIMLRNCRHYCCKDCFKEYCKTCKFSGTLKCSECGGQIDDRDVIGIIDPAELKNKIIDFVSPNQYSCKWPDCKGLWDNNGCKKKFRCPICQHENCLDCEDIHEKMSCEEFRQTERYQAALRARIDIDKNPKVICICKKMLIYAGGCGALYCDNCTRQICLFTGKLAGNKGPDYCGCTAKIPCHSECLYGCFPEDIKIEKPQPK